MSFLWWQSVYFDCVSDEVCAALKNLKTHTATGADGITSWMLKSFAAEIAPSIASLFNLSISSGKVPAAWKCSNIVPIPKDNSKANNVHFYRPISLLPIISKVLERHIYTHLLEFVNSGNLLSDQQFGFRKGRSTVVPLLLSTHQWHSYLEKKQKVACVFFDIKKAFDSVPQQALLNKLYHLCIPKPLFVWLTNYLRLRFQRVVLKGVSSTWLPVSSGVPQGSILGPLLFLLYINNITCLRFSSNTKILLFADDIMLYKPISSNGDFEAFQNDINLINQWMCNNHLNLNAGKTKFLLISRSKSSVNTCPNLHVNGLPIERVHHFKYLGVWISDDLSWSKHIEFVSCKARRLLGYLYRMFSPHCSLEAILHMYKCQVLPILEYGCIVWDPHLKKDQLLLENIQKFAVKIATKSWNSSTHHTVYLPSLSTRRQYFKLLYMYKFLNGLHFCPLGFVSFHSNPNRHVCHARHLLQPFARTVSYYNSFFYKYCTALELIT